MAYINGKEVLFSPRIVKVDAGGGDYDQGFEDGKNSVPQLERYSNTFRLTTLNALGKSEAVLNLDNINTLDLLCAIADPSQEVCKELTNITVEHLTINAPKLVNGCERMLSVSNYAVDRKMKRLTLNVDTQNSKSFYYAFNNLQALEIIDGTPIDITNASNVLSMFQATKSLIEVRFKGEIRKTLDFSYSPNLSDNTIQNIIEHLADLTGQTAQTLDFHSDIVLKLTDEQFLQIDNKNWSVI